MLKFICTSCGQVRYSAADTGEQCDAWRVAAADPRYYPAGTRLYIAGIGSVTVLDTGGDVVGPDRLDLFVGMSNRAEALAWGRRTMQVLILR